MAAQQDDELKKKALLRIEAMEAADYQFPQQFSRANWIAAGIVIAVLALLLIAGVWM